jgi:hypothetical protein
MGKLSPVFIAGEKFGMLTIIGDSGKKDGIYKLWTARCDCGVIRDYRSNRIKQKTIGGVSCGCRGKNLVGIKFGELEVLERTEKRSKDHKVIYRCLCSCGAEVEKPGGYLTSGDTKSCGCIKARATKDTHWTGFGEISGDYFSNIKRGAEVRGLEFNITIEYIWDLFLKQNRECKLSGVKINLSPNLSREEQTASLDRVDSKIGYTSENVQWVHKDVNFLKNKYSEEYLLRMCKMVANKFNGVKNE